MLNRSKIWLVQRLGHKMQIFPFLFFCDFVHLRFLHFCNLCHNFCSNEDLDLLSTSYDLSVASTKNQIHKTENCDISKSALRDEKIKKCYWIMVPSGFRMSGDLYFINQFSKKLHWLASTASDIKSAKIQYEFSWFYPKKLFSKH